MNSIYQLNKDLIGLLVCPVTGSALVYDTEFSRLVTVDGTLAYPVVSGIPMLLAEHAIELVGGNGF